jgi:protein tyrosine phosphatase (PTP) superfamily phosphohydrolase (DUF442 family)
MNGKGRFVALAAWVLVGASAGCWKQSYRPPAVAPPMGGANCPTCPPGGVNRAPPPLTPVYPGPGAPAANPPAVPRTGPGVSEYRGPAAQLGAPGAGSAVNPAAAKIGAPGNGAVAPAAGPVEIPTEIPRFAIVSDRAAAGLVPFPEGYAWLKGKGYRALLFLRSPDEDDAAIAEAAKKAGLAYKTIPVAPAQLNREKVEAFAGTLREDGPVFVCDQTGALAGAMWYLYFRLIDGQPEASALVRAQRLGLKEPGEGEATTKDLWDALRKVEQ